MNFITPAQCRAARGLLNWGQPELAERCDMHVQTISNFELENGSPTKNTLKVITDVLNNAGLILLENDGIARKSSGVTTYKGRGGFLNFILDVYETVKHGGDVCVSDVDENDFLKWEGDEADLHMARMASVQGLRCCFLIQEGDTNIVASHYATYRQVEKESFGEIPLYIYGDKTALIAFKEEDVEIFVIKHTEITHYFRKRFDEMWRSAKDIDAKQA